MKNFTNNSERNGYLKGNTLYMEVSRSEIVPGYLYYWIQNWNNHEEQKITKVCFLDNKTLYNHADLQGGKNWNDIKKISTILD